jgi:hypothetical protein
MPDEHPFSIAYTRVREGGELFLCSPPARDRHEKGCLPVPEPQSRHPHQTTAQGNQRLDLVGSRQSDSGLLGHFLDTFRIPPIGYQFGAWLERIFTPQSIRGASFVATEALVADTKFF